MAIESLRRRQVFDSMSALTTFAGAENFWDDLDDQARLEYANICRTQPNLKMFQLEKWADSEEIQAALAEYLEELADSEDAPQVNIDY